MADSSSGRPPAPLRVLELTGGVAGQACGRLMAALGHEVVKWEPAVGDPARRQDPLDEVGTGFGFTVLNADKQSLALDLEDRARRAELEKLLVGADVVVTDLAPRRARALELDAATLRRRYHRLVVVSITPFGLGDPRSELPGDSLLAEAYGGLANMIGEPGRHPLSLGGEQTAFAASFTGFLGMMLALEERDRDGSGDVVDVALCDVAAYMDWKSDVTYAVTGRVPRRAGSAGGRWRMAATSDGWIGVIFQPDQWGLVVKLVGDDRLADPRLADESVRRREPEAWWPIVQGWARSRTKQEIYDRAQALGLAFGLSTDVADLERSPQLRARRFVGPGISSTGPLLHCDALDWRSGSPPDLDPRRAVPWVPRPEDDPEGGASGCQPGSGHAAPEGGAAGPLSGVRVVDFGTITAGAATSRLLADYGATVIKVESADRPDSFRTWVPEGVERPKAATGTSAMFESNNVGKLGLALDLKSAAGQEVIERLVAGADVVVENFRVGVTERLGIDADRLRRLNPKLLCLSLSSQGQDGPQSEQRSYGSTLDLLSGLASVTGYPGGHPVWSSADVNYPDQLVSILGAGLVVYCLNRGIRGAHLDVAQREVVSWTLADRLAEHRATGRVAVATGNRRAGRTPHDTYACQGTDQWVAIACWSGAERRALAELTGIEDPGAGDERWWWAHQDQVDAQLAAWAGARTKAECAEQLCQAGVPCAPVQSAADRSSDPHFTDRRVFLGQGRRLKGFPFLLGRFDPPPPGPAPMLGQDTEAIERAPWPDRRPPNRGGPEGSGSEERGPGGLGVDGRGAARR